MLRRVLVFAVGILIALAAAGVAAPASPASPVTVTLDGAPLPGLAVAIYNDQPYVALSALPILHARVARDRAGVEAAVGVGRRTVLLAAGQTRMVVDGEERRLGAAPLIDKGEFWLPAAALESFMLQTSWDRARQCLSLRWPKPFLLAARLDETGDAPRLVVEATTAVKADFFSLKNPDRLVADLKGLVLYDFAALEDRENEYFQAVRCAQNRPGVLRLVLDLRQPVGWRIDHGQQEKGLCALELNTLVYGVAVVPADEGRRLVVETNVRPSWKTTTLAQPDRIVLEIDRADLVGPGGYTPGDGDWLRVAEYRQAGEGRVRITAFLARRQPYAVNLAPGRDNLLEIQPLQSLARPAWRPDGGLVIESSGVLSFTASVGHYPERLTLSVHHAAASPEEGAPAAGPVGRYRVVQAAQGIAKITLDLRYDAQPKWELSPDRHRLTVVFQPSPLAGKVIVLDPGHGGEDPGASGRTKLRLPDGTTGLLREKDINLDVALRLKVLLEEAGASVFLTRVDDTSVPLYARAPLADQLSAALYLSIHTNNIEEPSVRGIEMFSYPGRVEDRRLARLVTEEMVTALNQIPRRSTVDTYAVLRENHTVSILAELGFLSNPVDEAALATEEYRRDAARAILRGVTRYFRGEEANGELPVPGLFAH